MTNWRVLPSLAILGSALVLDAKATRRVSVKAKKTGGEKGEITATHQVCCIGKENLTAPQKSEGAVVVWAKLLSQLAGYRGSGGDCILTATYKASVAPDQSKFPHLIHPDRQFSSSQRIPAGGDGTSLGQSKELPFQCAKIRVHAEGRLAAALHKNKPSNFFLPELILPLTEGTKKTTSVQIEFGTGIREGKESLSLTPSTDKLSFVNGITSLLDSSKHALFSVCALTVTMGKAASKSSLENDFRFTAAAPRFAQYQFSTLSDIKVPEGLINDESDCLVLAFLDFEKANYADSVFMSPVGSAVAIKVFLKPLSENGSSRELRPQTYVRVYEELSGRDFFEFFRDHEVAFNWAMKSGALLEMVAEQINRSGVWSPVVPKCSSGSILGCTGRSQTIL